MNKKQQQANQIKEWKQQLRINKRKIQSNHKEIPKLFAFSSTIHPWNQKVSKLIADADAIDVRIGKQQNQSFAKLRKVNDQVSEFKQTLKFYDQTHEYLHKVENMSEVIVGKLQNFKGEMATSYDELAQIEERLCEDLQLYERKVDLIENGNDEEEGKKVNKIMKNKENKDMNGGKRQKMKDRHEEVEQDQSPIEKLQKGMKDKQEEVEDTELKIRELGKNLGWPEEDHNDFISIWNRCLSKNYFEIQEQLGGYFNFYTGEQIQEHMNKYMKLKKLNQKKKQLIGEYKEIKESKKREELKIFENNEYEKMKKVKVQELQRKAQQEQKVMKEKVQEWKKQKEAQKMNEKQRLIEMQHNKRRQQHQKRKEQQMRAKEELGKWKEQQEEKKQRQTIKASRKRPSSALNKQAIERIRERQEKLIQQRKQLAINKRLQQQQMQKKAQKIKQQKMIKYAYINSKVDEKTTAIKEKQRSKFDGKEKKDANTFGGQLLMTGVRATPSWRQGL